MRSRKKGISQSYLKGNVAGHGISGLELLLLSGGLSSNGLLSRKEHSREESTGKAGPHHGAVELVTEVVADDEVSRDNEDNDCASNDVPDEHHPCNDMKGEAGIPALLEGVVVEAEVRAVGVGEDLINDHDTSDLQGSNAEDVEEQRQPAEDLELALVEDADEDEQSVQEVHDPEDNDVAAEETVGSAVSGRSSLPQAICILGPCPSHSKVDGEGIVVDAHNEPSEGTVVEVHGSKRLEGRRCSRRVVEELEDAATKTAAAALRNQRTTGKFYIPTPPPPPGVPPPSGTEVKPESPSPKFHHPSTSHTN
eukprot:746459-Hanusia_phi.AAC.3